MSPDTPSPYPPRYRLVHFSRRKTGLIIAVTLLGIVTALPTFLPSSAWQHWPSWLPYNQLRLGIEFTGGARVVFAADRQAFQREYLVRLRKSVHDVLRENQHTRARVVVAGGQLIARFPSPVERQLAYKLLDANFNTFAHTWVKLKRQGGTATHMTIPSGVLDDALERAVDGVAERAKYAFSF